MRISDWSSDVCSSDLEIEAGTEMVAMAEQQTHARFVLRAQHSRLELLLQGGVERVALFWTVEADLGDLTVQLVSDEFVRHQCFPYSAANVNRPWFKRTCAAGPAREAR